jgi:hypothetical protein
VVGRWHQIAQEGNSLAAVIEPNDLMSLGIPSRNNDLQPGNNFRIPVYEFPLATLYQWPEVPSISRGAASQHVD